MCCFFSGWHICFSTKSNTEDIPWFISKDIHFSRSVHVDDTWTAVKKYITDVMKVDTEKEKVYYEEYDPIA